MSEFDAGRCLPLLLDVAVKSLVVSAAALAALPLLRRASASTRHLVLLAGLGVLLGLPALMPLLPRQSLPLPISPLPQLPRAEPLSSDSASPRLRGRGEESGLVPLPPGSRFSKAQGFSPGRKGDPPATLPPLPQPPAKTPAPASPPPVRPAWLVLGWLLGVLACAGRMLTAQARVWRLTRRCPPLPPSLLCESDTDDFALLKTSPAGTPPMVWGWPRPTLLLPPEAADWPPARLRAVLLHESAHVHRRDWLTQTLTQAACAVYWFNPLVWLLAARMNAEAERACDDAVLLSGVPPTEYAQDLLAVARSLNVGSTGGAIRRASVGAVTMARRSPVRGRLEAILDAHRPRRRLTRRAAALALAIALALSAPLAALRPAARADAPAAQPAPQAGVPTEADITRARQHLHDLEKARADYAAAHPNTLTAAQIAQVDRLIEAIEDKRGQEAFAAFEAANNKRFQAEAKKPHTKQERQQLWGPIYAYEHRPPTVLKREHDFNASLAQLKSTVEAFPVEQVARNTKINGFDRAVALDKTRIEMMQMERSLGYPLHIRPDDVAEITRFGLEWEKTGQMSCADYVHIALLCQKLNQAKHLDDADIESAIAILRAPSTTSSLSRTTIMGFFLSLRTAKRRDVPPAQRQKICEAVTPFLMSRDKWERKLAERVIKRFGANAPTPPGATP